MEISCIGKIYKIDRMGAIYRVNGMQPKWCQSNRAGVEYTMVWWWPWNWLLMCTLGVAIVIVYNIITRLERRAIINRAQLVLNTLTTVDSRASYFFDRRFERGRKKRHKWMFEYYDGLRIKEKKAGRKK